jgi:uncharacterized Zn finger protein
LSRYNGRWPAYVSVAQRRKKAEREMAKLRKNGHPVTPVVIEGRAVATTFWGKAWCENLEGYHDYENRLPRGRSYVRNGSVVDLQIAPLMVTALVSGSSIYRVKVSIAAVPKAHWRSICRDCIGGIASLVELLQGRFSKGVMERLCRQEKGLFPRPSEIKFSCSCPDYASMCKHVAAVLYGVGARLDENPTLLFRLRAVDENDLLGSLDAAVPLSTALPAPGNILKVDDVSALFGLEMASGDAPVDGTECRPIAAAGRKVRPRKAAPEPVKVAVQPSVVRATTHAGKRSKAAEALGTSPVPPPATKPKSKRASARPAVLKPTFDLTPDGYVKWWK